MNSLLDCHYLHEHNTQRFTCQKCMKPFPTRKARATHLQKDHKRVHPFPQWGTCSVCSWKGPGLAKHWKKEHPGQFGCGISKMVFKNSRFLAKNPLIQKKLLYFVNAMNDSLSKKILLSKLIFFFKNWRIFFSFNRSSRRKRGMASNPLFIIPDLFLHFPNELSYEYLRFEGNGKILLGR